MVKPHDPEWTEEHQKASELTEYKPDWDSIPKEFKYCYYSVCEHSGKVERKILSNCKMFPSVIGKMHLKRADRPPTLVDGAWYAVRNAFGEQFAGEYSKKDNEIQCDGEWVGVSELTVHNRIPDELWGIE